MSRSSTERRTYLVPVNRETIDALAAGASPAELATGSEPDLSNLQLFSPPVWSTNEFGGRKLNHILYSDGEGIWAWWGVDEEDMARMMAIYTAGLTPGKPAIRYFDVFPLERPPEEEELLARIAADPDADEPRLEYAAWLDARGDLRGEVIRLQIEMHHCDDHDEDRFPQLWERCQAILEEHGREWFKPLAALNVWPTLGAEFCPEFFMHRGLLESAWIHVEDVLPDHAEELWSFAPTLSSLAFFETVDVPGLAALPQLQKVRELSILVNDPEGAGRDMEALANSPNLTQLRSLAIGYTLDDVAGRTLVDAPWFKNLREIDLQRAKLSAEVIEDLVARSDFAGIETLDLGGEGISDRAAVLISENPSLRGLTTLRLIDAPLSGAAFRELTLAAWPKLQLLDLGGCPLRDDDVEFLANQPSLPALEQLNLQGAIVGERAVAALVGSPYLQKITSIDVDRNDLTDDDVAVLEARFGDALTVHE